MPSFSSRNKKSNSHIQAQRYKSKIKTQVKPRSQLKSQNKQLQLRDWSKIFTRLLQIVIASVVMATVVWGYTSFHRNNQLPVAKVQVVSTYAHLDPKLLQQIISNHLEGNFFDLNVISLKQDLLVMPWVHEVFIRRKWPDAIVVKITEQQPVAQWKENALVSANGALFTPPKKTFPVGLSLLLGPEEDVQEVIMNYRKMQQLLLPLNFTITQLDLSEQRAWHMILRGSNSSGGNSINIFLGNENVLNKLQNFITAYPKIVASNPSQSIEAVDLRYKSGAAVRWSATGS